MLTRSLCTAAALFALPALAVADPIPQQTLNEHRDACVAKCSSSKSEVSCLQLCDCVTKDIAQNWTIEDLQMRNDRVSADVNDAQVNREYQQMGHRCMSNRKSWDSGS